MRALDSGDWVLDLARPDPDGVLVVDGDGLVIGGNARFGDLLQLEGAIAGRSMDSVVGADLAERIRGGQAAVESSGWARLAATVERTDGELLPIVLTIRPLPGERKSQAYRIELREDSEARRLGRELSEARRQVRALATRLPMPALLATPAGTVSFANGAAEKLLRGRRTTLRGVPMVELLPMVAGTAQPGTEAARSPSAGGTRFECVRLPTPDGPGALWFAAEEPGTTFSTLPALTAPGVPGPVAEAFAETLSMLISEATSRLRPMEAPPERSWAERRDQLRSLSLEWERQGHFAQDLLAIARLARGTLNVRLAEIPWSRVLQFWLPAMQERALNLGTELSAIDPPMAERVTTDPRLLGRILESLVGGSLESGARRTTLSWERRPGATVVSIIHDGPGLSDAAVQRANTAKSIFAIDSDSGHSIEEFCRLISLDVARHLGIHCEVQSTRGMGVRIGLTLRV